MTGEFFCLRRVTRHPRQMQFRATLKKKNVFSIFHEASARGRIQQKWESKSRGFSGNDQTMTTMFCGNFVYNKICFEVLRSESKASFFILMARCEQGQCLSADVRQDGQIGNNERLCHRSGPHCLQKGSGGGVEGRGGGLLC